MQLDNDVFLGAPRGVPGPQDVLLGGAKRAFIAFTVKPLIDVQRVEWLTRRSAAKLLSKIDHPVDLSRSSVLLVTMVLRDLEIPCCPRQHLPASCVRRAPSFRPYWIASGTNISSRARISGHTPRSHAGPDVRAVRP